MSISYTSLTTPASVPNWQLVSSQSPSGTSSVTFSSLSGYSKYRLMSSNLTIAVGTQNIFLSCNGDFGSNYSRVGLSPAVSTLVAGTGPTSSFNLFSLTTSVAELFIIDIEGALLLAPKVVSLNYWSSSANNGLSSGIGMYQTTSALTSLTLTLGGSTFNGGSVYLLGAN